MSIGYSSDHQAGDPLERLAVEKLEVDGERADGADEEDREVGVRGDGQRFGEEGHFWSVARRDLAARRNSAAAAGGATTAVAVDSLAADAASDLATPPCVML